MQNSSPELALYGTLGAAKQTHTQLENVPIKAWEIASFIIKDGQMLLIKNKHAYDLSRN